jgi:hypothetical protein
MEGWNEPMHDIDSILEKLNEDANIGEIRNTIADLIVDHLQKVRSSLGYWEKTHFTNAIVAWLGT